MDWLYILAAVPVLAIVGIAILFVSAWFSRGGEVPMLDGYSDFRPYSERRAKPPKRWRITVERRR
jgi:hypothetical protein